MLELQTFGGLTIAVDGQCVTGAPTQRRRLAVLVLLAVAGDRGLSRDKVLALIWPESEPARARHALAQLVYAERRDLEAENLFLGVKTLRLNPQLIQTDVALFEQACGRGDAGAAIALYRGAFLDGFHLPGSLEFEHWVESQRERFAALAAEMSVREARAAGSRGDRVGAVSWWREAVRVDRYRTEHAIGLMHSMVEAGDAPGAVRHGRAFQRQIQSDLELPPDPQVGSMLQRLGDGRA